MNSCKITRARSIPERQCGGEEERNARPRACGPRSAGRVPSVDFEASVEKIAIVRIPNGSPWLSWAIRPITPSLTMNDAASV